MPKIIFKAEARLPKQVILPLLVARAADSQRTITIRDREIEVAEPIADFLQERYPKLVEAAPATKSETSGKGNQPEEKPPAGSKPEDSQGDPDADPVDDQAADDAAPSEAKLKRMTIAQLQQYAADESIDLGDATKHADIVDVIFKAVTERQQADQPPADGS